MKIALILSNIVAATYVVAAPPDYLADSRYRECGENIEVGWVYNPQTDSYTEPTPLPPVQPVTSFGRIITVLAYRLRFTQAERVTLKMVSSGAGTEAAAVAVSMEDLMSAGYINLDHPATVEGTNALEMTTLLGVGRASEILSPPVYSGELLAQSRKHYGLPEVPTNSELSYNNGKGYSPEQYTLFLAGQL